MLYAAAVVYFLTIIFGVGNMLRLIQKVIRYQTIALIHGCLAATGWLLVFIHILMVGCDLILFITFGVLSVATLGGLTLLMLRLKHKHVPVPLRFLHPIVALVGFFFLISYLLP